MKTFAIIGLGRFGAAIALELSSLGHEVMAVDTDEDKVRQVADKVTHAVTADARKLEVLQALGLRNFDCAVVAMGGDVGNSALVTLNLKELGIPQVVCKAQSHVHRKVLEKIGADRVIFPEHEMGQKVAQGLSSSSVLNFIEFSEDYGIVELEAPSSWRGKTLRELDVRNAFHVTVIALRRNGTLDVSPRADVPIEAGDNVVALGRSEDINRLHEVS